MTNNDRSSRNPPVARSVDLSANPRWPIWVISLPDAHERRGAVAAQLNKLGLPFAFIDAVDGRQGLAPEFERYIDRPGTRKLKGYGMSDGEYACALSHQEAYRRILDAGLPGAIILEDDAILTHRFRRFYDERSYEAAPLIQFFFFGGVAYRGRAKNTPSARLERLSENAWGAVAYSISAKAAAIMRHASLPLRAQADWPCNTAKLIGHYVTIPRLVLHPASDHAQSTLAPTRQEAFPPGFDFSYGYAKGWRRLYSPASWKRLIRRRFTRPLHMGFDPTPAEYSSIVEGDDHAA